MTDKHVKAYPTLRKGFGFGHTAAAPDVSGHMPRAASSAGAEAVTAPRNDFTNRQQPICARAQETLPQLSHLNLGMPKGQEWIQVTKHWPYFRWPAQSSLYPGTAPQKQGIFFLCRYWY